MRIKFTVILLILNVAAFFYIYELERQSGPERDFTNKSAIILPDALTIDKITIETRNDDGETIRTLVRERNRWEIVKPFRWLANGNAVQRILTQLQFLEVETVIPIEDITDSGQTLADFGLEEPQITLKYTGTGGETTLKIGAPTKLGSRLYLLAPDGEQVLVVSRELLESIDVSLDNLRSSQIFDLPIFEIRSLRIVSGAQRIVMDKTGDTWQFETPVNVPADPEMVASTLGMLTASQALKLIPNSEVDQTRMGLTNPFMRVTLTGNERRETLILGDLVEGESTGKEDDAERYAQLETASADGTVFTVRATNFDWLVNATDELRERRFFNFKPDDITAIHITQGDSKITLQKLEKRSIEAADSWQVLVPGKAGTVISQPGDGEIINTLFTNLRELKAESFVSDAPSPADETSYGFDSPNAVIQLDNGQPLGLILGKVDKDNARMIYAKRESQPYVYSVTSRILGQVSANPLTYRSRVLEEQPPSARISRIQLIDLQDDKTLLDLSIDPDKQTWLQSMEGKPEEEQTAVLGLVDSIKEFTVKNYLYSEFKEVEAAPWRYKLLVDILLPGAENTQTITRTFFFSFRIRADRQIGGSPDADMTFTLTEALIDNLFELTFEEETPELPANEEEVKEAKTTEIPDKPNPSGPPPGPGKEKAVKPENTTTPTNAEGSGK
ncbi:DUF4340 domain-containing protein [Rubellicoccus peritrichatus]|uniref:DUF4340 domain-containing protein n=1 Tax=Rubellicoccus peritrichatus TaxID=3080537 RepID=A0AAQ3L870_9BACT|nr:DUF4340 domain-containing protein [Puniceicoccus sp. CR14]WOO40676.1 DUF4340 domain-containing protein [Puniceicoccus sp. CR14]